MRVLYIVNTADAQSIPLELGLAIREAGIDLNILSYYGKALSPQCAQVKKIKSLNAKRIIDLRAMKVLTNEIRTFKPDIIHLHHLASTVVTSPIAFHIDPKISIVKTEHNDHRKAPFYQKLLFALFSLRFRSVIANSKTTLASLNTIEKMACSKRATFIYNGVNLQSVAHTSASSERRELPVIGTVGRLVEQKNHESLLRAFAKVAESKKSRIVLEIIGDGPLRDDLEMLSKKLKISGCVTFLGAMTRQEVYKKLGEWHGFIMPSHFEGFCNALIEALAAGLPVAHSDIDTLLEVCPKPSITFSAKKVNEIASAIEALLNDPPAANQAKIQKYCLDRSAKLHVEHYDTLHRERKTHKKKEHA